MPHFLTEGDLENLITQDIDTSFTGWIESVIEMVEGYIDDYTGQEYTTGSVTQTRYYDGSGGDKLLIDPYSAITAVKILDSTGNVERTLNSTDYFLYPLNSSGLMNTLQLSPGGEITSFPDRVRSVQVEGTFGYVTVPPAVKLAGAQMAAKIINEGLRGGQPGSESLGSYSINYRMVDETAETLGIKDILNMYRRLEVA
jgi:hypothetical protein